MPVATPIMEDNERPKSTSTPIFASNTAMLQRNQMFHARREAAAFMGQGEKLGAMAKELADTVDKVLRIQKRRGELREKVDGVLREKGAEKEIGEVFKGIGELKRMSE